MELKEVKINEIIKPENFSFLKNCCWRVIDLYLPTEVVITKPQIVSPQVARLFLCNFYDHLGKVVSYEQLFNMYKNPKNFPGSSHFDEVGILEIWENFGDDGHIEYLPIGYSFVKMVDIQKFVEEREYPVSFVSELRWQEHVREQASIKQQKLNKG